MWLVAMVLDSIALELPLPTMRTSQKNVSFLEDSQKCMCSQIKKQLRVAGVMVPFISFFNISVVYAVVRSRRNTEDYFFIVIFKKLKYS